MFSNIRDMQKFNFYFYITILDIKLKRIIFGLYCIKIEYSNLYIGPIQNL